MPRLAAGDQVYFTKNDSSIYAFRIGQQSLAESGIRLICAHCDSPTFRIKPNAEMSGDGNIMRLNTEVYGGAILSPWLAAFCCAPPMRCTPIHVCYASTALS